MSFDRMIEKIVETQNPTVAGLDPKLAYIPTYILEEAVAEHGKTLEGAAAALIAYNKGLIDALCDIVPAVKPQAAYYEMYGWQGVRALAETIAYARAKGMFVITDGKRNDIGTTMEAYATAHLGTTDVLGEPVDAFGADALTVNGYLGTDGVKPLLGICGAKDKGIFVLVKTSNPSSGELQDQKLESGRTVYETMGAFCETWGEAVMGKYGYSGVGAVVGATYPAQLGEMREKAPHTFFLVPGYGAQGGGADDVAPAFDKNGLGAIINSSRGIMCAWQKEKCDERDYAQAARREAIRMRDAILARIGEIRLGE
ncbi:MAG: orotidine-5'-phosphate decarboxylase [Hominenteromicrobium sp.]